MWCEDFFRAKPQRFGTNGDDVCGYCNPLGGDVVVTFSPFGLCVKILDHLDLDDGDALRCYPLKGVDDELRYPSVSLWWLQWQVRFALFIFLYL